MSDKVYPIHFKKIVNGGVVTAYAHNKTEEEKFLADGYIDQNDPQWQRTPALSYPSLMYAKDGKQVRCESAEHEKTLKGEGYSTKPIVKKETAPVGAVGTASPDSNSRIDAIEESVKDLKLDIGRILEALGEPKKKAS